MVKPVSKSAEFDTTPNSSARRVISARSSNSASVGRPEVRGSGFTRSDGTVSRMSIGIVGLGYVGLPLAVAFAEEGEDVIGVDVDLGKVAGLREGRSHV